jgi:ribosome-associated heat shock protein Hsp15
MRLDLFLKTSRICPRRTLAQQLCDAGHVFLNGVPVKSAHAVKPGDEITLQRRDKKTILRVLSVPEQRQVSRKDTSDLYEILSETVQES